MAPYWIISMWMLFATTLNVSLRWMRGRYFIALIAGAIAGPLAYIGGSKLGGIVFLDRTAGLVALSVGWGVIMPILVMLAERLDGISPGVEAKPATVEVSS